MKKDESKNEVDVLPNSGYHEIFLFCGNPGAGKSLLCNSIFQQPIFKAGFHPIGLTTSRQGYIFDNKLYVDTPGLIAADTNLGEEAVQAIGEVLRKNSKYKIIFVITLESGQLRLQDMEMINAVCKVTKPPLNYGLIINKVDDADIPKIKATMDNLLNFFTKRPSSTCIIKRDKNIEDTEKMLIKDPTIRQELITFINNLQANNPEHS